MEDIGEVSRLLRQWAGRDVLHRPVAHDLPAFNLQSTPPVLWNRHANALRNVALSERAG